PPSSPAWSPSWCTSWCHTGVPDFGLDGSSTGRSPISCGPERPDIRSHWLACTRSGARLLRQVSAGSSFASELGDTLFEHLPVFHLTVIEEHTFVIGFVLLSPGWHRCRPAG